MVTRYRIASLRTTEQTSTQVQLLGTHALASQGLPEPATGEIPTPDGDHAGPIRVAWSDNGPEMTSGDTREFVALMTIIQRHGRPGTPTDEAQCRELLFARAKCLAPPRQHPRPRGVGCRARPRVHRVAHRAHSAQRSAVLHPPTSTPDAGPPSAAHAPPAASARQQRLERTRNYRPGSRP